MALTCNIAAIVGKQCGGTLGGVKRIWAIGIEDLTSITVVSNAVTVITAGASFFELTTVDMDGATRTEQLVDPTGNNMAKVWNQSASIIINALTAANRVAVEGITACCELVLVVERGDGSRYLVGVDQESATPYWSAPVKNMMVTVDNEDWGNPGGGAIETLTFTGMTKRKSIPLAAACVIP